jgi:hypothetical protein
MARCNSFIGRHWLHAAAGATGVRFLKNLSIQPEPRAPHVVDCCLFVGLFVCGCCRRGVCFTKGSSSSSYRNPSDAAATARADERIVWVLARFGEVMNPESRSCDRCSHRTAEKSSYPVHVLPVISTKAKSMRSQIGLNLAWLNYACRWARLCLPVHRLGGDNVLHRLGCDNIVLVRSLLPQ